jgi:hypothetical protein
MAPLLPVSPGINASSRFFNGEMQRYFAKQPDHHSQMADYYSILANAVGRLDPNTGMARQQLYQRARSAMISELENVYPPFRRSEIATAEIALESAIEKAEAEAVRRSSKRTSDIDQGPPIHVPAPPANENATIPLSLRLCRSE